MNDKEFQKYQRSLFLDCRRDRADDSDEEDGDSLIRGHVEDSDSASGIMFFKNQQLKCVEMSGDSGGQQSKQTDKTMRTGMARQQPFLVEN